MINPFIAFNNKLKEETLNVEVMQLAIKQKNQLLEDEEKLKEKFADLEEDIKKGQIRQVYFFKDYFTKKIF